MNDLTAGADTPAADGAQPEATVESPASTPDQPTTENVETDQAEPDTGDDEAAKPKKKHWAHERIDELTRQRREAERQAEFWKAKASKSVDYDSLDYEQGIAERTIQRTREEQADTALESAALLAREEFGYRETIARERFPDYDAVAHNPNVPISDTMAQVILKSENGPEIAYHLGKNPQEAARIARLPALDQAAELGAIKAKLNAPKAPPKQPPAPVDPVSGIRAGGSKDPAKMTMAEYVAWRNAGNG